LDKVLMGASCRAAVRSSPADKETLGGGRYSGSHDHIKRAGRPVLRHRLAPQLDAYLEGYTTDDPQTMVLQSVEVQGSGGGAAVATPPRPLVGFLGLSESAELGRITANRVSGFAPVGCTHRV
jgi:hypothetical protein